MAILMIKAQDVTNADPIKDRRGCWKRGYIVAIKPDGFDSPLNVNWLNSSYPPSNGRFVYVKIPGVAIDNPVLLKYVQVQLEDQPNEYGRYDVYRRRRWTIRVAAIPTALRNKLLTQGSITVRVGSYSGDYDVTWNQVKNYIRDLKTNLDETEDI